jgi:uncharacterized delta-60 repeat protein
MRRRLLWFWPLAIAIPVALGVVIRSSYDPAQAADGWSGLTVVVFSYTTYYFVLSWPVWLMRLSQTRRMVISSLVPVAVLAILALPLPQRAPLLDVTVFRPAFSLWFRPGEILHGKLTEFTAVSPCEVSLWAAAKHGLSAEIVDVTYQPDGRILIQAFISKEGTFKSGYKLSRLLPDGSIDPTFQQQPRCMSLTAISPGHIHLQPDGRILLVSSDLSSSPSYENALALILSPEGEELRRVTIPRLYPDQHVEGVPVEVQLQPDGGLLMYGGFHRQERSMIGSPILRITPEGLPDLSSWREMSGLDVADSVPGARGADGRRFIAADNPKYEKYLLPAVYAISADGLPDAAFQERLLGIQRERGWRQVRALAAQADGKLVVVFDAEGDSSEVVRLNPDGALDDTFQATKLPFSANRLIALADGAFIVAELGLLNAQTQQAPGVLVRLDSNGRVDEAVTGRFRSAFAEREITHILNLAVKPDGTVLLHSLAPHTPGTTGYQLVQLLPDGSLDTGSQRPP